jgi:hypothetical protein
MESISIETADKNFLLLLSEGYAKVAKLYKAMGEHFGNDKKLTISIKDQGNVYNYYNHGNNNTIIINKSCDMSKQSLLVMDRSFNIYTG